MVCIRALAAILNSWLAPSHIQLLNQVLWIFFQNGFSPNLEWTHTHTHSLTLCPISTVSSSMNIFMNMCLNIQTLLSTWVQKSLPAACEINVQSLRLWFIPFHDLTLLHVAPSFPTLIPLVTFSEKFGLAQFTLQPHHVLILKYPLCPSSSYLNPAYSLK